MAPSIPRSRLGHLTMAAVATIALAAALLASSPVAAQSASSSSVAAIERRMAELANRSRAAAAQVTPLTISPIQQMVFNAGEDGSSRSDRAGATAAVVGEGGDGHLAGGFCRLQR